MNDPEEEAAAGRGRVAALLVVGAMATTGLSAAWILLSPAKPAAVPAGNEPGVFAEARAGDLLRERLYNLQDTRVERDSTLENPPELDAGAEPDAAPGKPARAPSSSERGGSTWKLMKKAENYFFSMKHSKRFKDSKALKDFNRDFLANPELKGINDRYYKEHRNAVRFVVETVKSPGFRSVVKKHVANADVSAFVHAMMGSGSVMLAAKTVSKEFNLKPYLDAMPIPGLGTLGAVNAKGKGLTAPPSSAQTLRMMNLDPEKIGAEVGKRLKSPAP